MNSKRLAALALTAALAAGAAHAGGRPDVQWSVTIGGPLVGVAVGSPVYEPRYEPRYEPAYPPVVYAPRVYAPVVYVPAPPPRVYEGYGYAPRVIQQPVVVLPQRGVYRAGWHHGHGDADRDGIPDRYDRVYNPRWDRDGDGIPNRYDPRPNRPGR